MSYKESFIEFMVRAGVLSFGDFVTKSGRKTPFFINTGNYKTGEQVARLGIYYADCINEKIGPSFDCLYGPAYKGIPLVVTTVMALFQKYGINKKFCFNRKEVKDHGEGGSLIGYKPSNGDRIVIVEDVITAGTSVRESFSLLKSIADVEIKALVVSVDRMEKGLTNKSALQEIEEELGIQTVSIVNLREIINYLSRHEVDGKFVLDEKILEKIKEYIKNYGVENL